MVPLRILAIVTHGRDKNIRNDRVIMSRELADRKLTERSPGGKAMDLLARSILHGFTGTTRRKNCISLYGRAH